MFDTHSLPLKRLAEDFSLEVCFASTDFQNVKLTVVDVARPGLQLAGYFDHFEPMRLQVMGNAEMSFLSRMTALQRLDTYDRLFSYKFPALLLARDRYPDADKLRALDSVFTEANLSPGGSADLLAATYFIHLLKA